MVLLKISSGKTAGQTHTVRQFPFCIGRSPAADLRLEADGVWDRHLELDFDPDQGFILTTQAGARAFVNGWQIQSVILRNGDSIELGSEKLRFWLGETKQSGLRFYESLVWVALIVITVCQAGLIFLLK